MVVLSANDHNRNNLNTRRDNERKDHETQRFHYIGEERLFEQCRHAQLPQEIRINRIDNRSTNKNCVGYFYDLPGLRDWNGELPNNWNPDGSIFSPTVLVSECDYDKLDNWDCLRNVNAHLNVNAEHSDFTNQLRQLLELRAFTRRVKQISQNPKKQEATLFEQIESSIHSFLTKLETTHNRLFLHGRRTSVYARIIAKEIGWDERQRHELYLATILHDLGKVLVPRNILYKEGSLTDEEYSIVQTHTSRGAQFFDNYDHPLLNRLQSVIRHHHEKWNGSGYPDGLRNDEIPLSARILAVADVFDAVTQDRAYRDPMDFSEAVELVQEDRGTHFDPDIVDIFMEKLPKIKKIQAGEVAVVEAV